MTFIGDKKHPRKPSWRWFMCDECFDNFWSPFGATGRGEKHYCETCASDRVDLHAGGNSGDVGASTDRHYHGGRFGGAEW